MYSNNKLISTWSIDCSQYYRTFTFNLFNRLSLTSIYHHISSGQSLISYIFLSTCYCKKKILMLKFCKGTFGWLDVVMSWFILKSKIFSLPVGFILQQIPIDKFRAKCWKQNLCIFFIHQYVGCVLFCKATKLCLRVEIYLT